MVLLALVHHGLEHQQQKDLWVVLDVAQVQEALLEPKPVNGTLVQQGLVYLHLLLVGVTRRGSLSC